jgi:hypothetical protein
VPFTANLYPVRSESRLWGLSLDTVQDRHARIKKLIVLESCTTDFAYDTINTIPKMEVIMTLTQNRKIADITYNSNSLFSYYRFLRLVHDETSSISPFGQPDWHASFTPDRVAIETMTLPNPFKPRLCLRLLELLLRYYLLYRLLLTYYQLLYSSSLELRMLNLMKIYPS